MYCKKPDRDVPKLVCGYPLPCPHHTLVMDLTEAPTVTVPPAAKVSSRARKRVSDIAQALKPKK